ncbi:cell division protein FtsQ/DivIB [Saccharopolyspora griseoalba]|uniref:Cell division protein FtsQ/DivIB n=1 Tax=Saccharopolyspora griseoalba TaxID=1431848 RepID=A0ABW2LG78_9PSEU
MTSTRTGAAERPGRRSTRRRPERASPPSRRWVLPALMAVVTVVVLVLYFSPLLGVRDVRVEGNPTLSDDEVLRAAQIPPGTAMLQVDAGDVQERLGKLPKVADSEVMLDWPSTVRVEITERTPAVYFRAPGGVRLVDSQGVAFETAPKPPAGVPELRVPEVDGAATAAALKVLNGLTEQVRREVTAVLAPEPGSVRLRLTGDRVVEWGSLKEGERKAAILRPLLTRPGKVYDVTTPELPTVR